MKEVVRRINYFSTAFVSILGFSLTSEIFQEDDFVDKIDDILMLLLSIGVIIWYKKKGYKAEKTAMSLLAVGIGLVIKIIAIVIEHADKEAVGDDIGIMVGLVLAFAFVLWHTLGLRKTK